MQIVIDIPDKIKKQVDAGKAAELYIPLWLAYSIANGKPLPKNHGRLIDADAVINQEYGCYWETEKDLQFAPTIVPAHYEEDNNNDKV